MDPVSTALPQDLPRIFVATLYQDEITVEPGDVIPVLAAASLFQLEGVINQCLVIMDETVNVETVVRYWEACQQYGCAQMSKVCVDWLTVNLLSNMPDHPARLREISPALMSDLVSSAHLFVMQTEFSVYVLLRLWMFLQLHPAWDGEPQDQSCNEESSKILGEGPLILEPSFCSYFRGKQQANLLGVG